MTLDLEDTAGDANNVHNNACPFIPLRSEGAGELLELTRIRNMNLCEAEDCPPELEIALLARFEPRTHQTCVESIGSSCQGIFLCPNPPICCPPCPGADCPIAPMDVLDLAWYRITDNDPFILQSFLVDKDSYSRSVVNLPIGDSYAASANRLVGEELGYPNAQSVMFSTRDSDTVELGLAADDANMVWMGRSGADRDAGTADDYSVQLVFTRDCPSAAVEVSFSRYPQVPAIVLSRLSFRSVSPGLSSCTTRWLPHFRPTSERRST